MSSYEVSAYRPDGTLAACAFLFGASEHATKREGTRLARHYPGVALRLVIALRVPRRPWREVFERGPGARRWTRVKGGA